MVIHFPKLFEHQSDVEASLFGGTWPESTKFVIKSSRQKGKSYLLNVLLLETAIRKPGSVSILIEPVAAQARRQMRNLLKGLKRSGLVESSNSSDLIVTFKNGSEIDFISAESKDNIRGNTVSGILVIDEAAFISDDVYDTALPFTNVHKAPVLMVSSPLFEEGFFFKEYSDNGNVVFDWSSDKYDFSALISEKQIKEYAAKMSSLKFRTEILGEFLKNKSEVFGDYMKSIRLPLDLVPVYGGIDFSTGNGNDETVLTLMNSSRQVVFRWATNNMQPGEQVNYLAGVLNSFSSLRSVYAEINSIGQVYYDLLQSKLLNKAILKKFETNNDTKREIIDELVLAFQEGTIGIDNDPVLLRQLGGFVAKRTSSGKLTYENISTRLHDDRVMSLAFCNHNFSQKKIGSFGFSRK